MGAPLGLPVQAPVRPASVRARSFRRRGEPGLLVVCVLLLLLATVPPLINLGRFQRRIAGAISQSIGRPVRMGSVSLRMLPWPALDIHDFQVDEEPGFGAEPALVAPEVLAELRLSSLWRGRLELSRVELSDASVNLLRLPTGRWNISSVLLSASHVPNAPTGQSRSGPAPRFPYIQATGTRINFKRGVEKLPYSILNADFSMVLVRPEVWQLRLEGQPVRTDMDLASGDTGTVRLEGELHRASALGTMPLAFHAAWNHAALGQLSRLLLGYDAGWRGDVDATAQLDGEINTLQISTHVILANLHRQEFAPEQPFTLDAACRGSYSHSAGALQFFRCRLPLGAGDAMLGRGGVAAEDLTLTLHKVPASTFASILALLGHESAPPRTFGGDVEGTMRYLPGGSLAGVLTSDAVTIAHGRPDGSPLTLTGLMLRPSANGRNPLLLSADPVSLGSRDRRLVLSAEFSREGYAVHANGSGALDALQAAASSLHLPAFRSLSGGEENEPEASAELSLTHAGRWSTNEVPEPPAVDGFPSMNVTGSVDLEHVRWKVPRMPITVDFPQLHAALSPGLAAWTTPGASVGEGDKRMELAGEAQTPLGCASESPCTTQFSARTVSLDAAAVEALFRTESGSLVPAWLNRFDASHAGLPAVTGAVRVGVLTLGRLPVRDAVLRFTTASAPSSPDFGSGAQAGPAIRVESVDGRALGGSLHMEGLLRLPGDGAHYAVHAALTGASAAQAAALWHENWGPGTLSGDMDLQFSGDSMEEILSSTRGTFRASWLHGGLQALPRFTSWDAAGTVGADGMRLERGTLASPPARLDGHIGWDRSLLLHFAPGDKDQPGTVTGTLADPLLAETPAENAAR